MAEYEEQEAPNEVPEEPVEVPEEPEETPEAQNTGPEAPVVLVGGVQTRNLHHYKAIHTQRPGKYGTTSMRRYQYLMPHIKRLRPDNILDYGCGSSRIVKRIADGIGAEAWFFDPAVEDINRMPEGFLQTGWEGRLVVCTHVLEHMDESELDTVIEQLTLLAPHAFIEVPTTPSRTVLPSGERAHTIVKSKDWWEERLKKYWPNLRRVSTERRSDVSFITWFPSEPGADGGEPEPPKVRRKVRRRRVVPPRRVVQPPRKMKQNAPSVQPFRDLTGKRVAVVGRAKSLVGSGEGEYIDSFDVVVRINEKLPLNPKWAKDIGSRTDLMYTCRNCGSSRATAIAHGAAAEMYTWEFRKSLSEKGGYTPFTGTVAVFQMLARGAEHVYATGMDLYVGPSTSGVGGHLKLHEKNSYAYHDPNGDAALLKKLLEERPERFSCGKALREVLEATEPLKHYRGLTLEFPTVGSLRAARRGGSPTRTSVRGAPARISQATI